MKPSQLADLFKRIIAEECGCQAAWDLLANGNPCGEVTVRQQIAIESRISSEFDRLMRQIHERC